MNITANDVVVDGFSFNGSGNQMNISGGAVTLDGVKVQNNIFSGYGSGVGIPTYNAGNLLITKNLFKNPLASTEAMQIKADASTLGGCDGTVVSDNVFTAASNNGGADINFSCTSSNSSNVTVSGNTDAGNTGGSSFVAFSGITGNILVTDNTATTSGSTVFFWGSVSGSAQIENNKFTGGGGSGISIHGGDNIGTNDTPNAGVFTITGNDLSSNLYGIHIANTALGTGAEVNANRNNVSGNSSDGVDNESTLTADGTCNWWGDASGPRLVGPGSGSNVTTDVTYTPWLVSSDLVNGSCTGGASVTTDAATSLATTGATLNGTNGAVAADHTSFWWGTTSISDPLPGASPAFPSSGWFYTTNFAQTPSVPAGGTFSAPITGLTPGTTYYFIAWSEVGGIWYPGEVLNFTTPAGPVPSAITNTATDMTTTGATLNGTNGAVAADHTSFWWGTTSISDPLPGASPAFPSSGWFYTTNFAQTPSVPAGGTFSAPITGLTPGTTYYFIAWSEVGGIWYPGSVLSFVTTPPVYTGSNSCGAGDTLVLLSNLTQMISSTNPDPVTLTLPNPGSEYLFEATGDYGYGGDPANNTINRADAGYATGVDWSTTLDSVLGIAPGATYRGVTSLLSDMGTGQMGIVDWGSYNSSHDYKFDYVPPAPMFSLLFPIGGILGTTEA